MQPKDNNEETAAPKPPMKLLNVKGQQINYVFHKFVFLIAVTKYKKLFQK